VSFSIGDRVLLPAVHVREMRGLSDRPENICEAGMMLGNHMDGGYAEYVAVPPGTPFLCREIR
jgi:D-arabinose 1-dehydrogenase-like Zn-dependent alcohol dehydrogenase